MGWESKPSCPQKSFWEYEFFFFDSDHDLCWVYQKCLQLPQTTFIYKATLTCTIMSHDHKNHFVASICSWRTHSTNNLICSMNKQSFFYSPDSDGSCHWIIWMNNRVNSLQEFIHIQNLIQVFFTLLNNLQNAKPQKITPAKKRRNIGMESTFLFDF